MMARRGTSERCSWIAAVYSVLLMLDLCINQVAGLSACHDPPQVIRISRGQKINVVYWVGQNALEAGGGQQPWKPEETSTASSITTDASSEEPAAVPSQTPIAEKTPSTSSNQHQTTVASETTTKVNVTGGPEIPAAEADKTSSTAAPPSPPLASNHDQRPQATAVDTTFGGRLDVTSSTPLLVVDQNTNGSNETKTKQQTGPANDQSDATSESTNQASVTNKVDFRSGDQSGNAEVTSIVPATTNQGVSEQDTTVLAEREQRDDVTSSDLVDSTANVRQQESRDLSTEKALASNDALTEISYWNTTPEPSSGTEGDLPENRSVNQEEENGTSTAALSDEEEVTGSQESTTQLAEDEATFTSRSAVNETQQLANVTDGSGRAEKVAEESFSDESSSSTELVTGATENKVNDTATADEDVIEAKSVLEAITTTIRSILSTFGSTPQPELTPLESKSDISSSDVSQQPLSETQQNETAFSSTAPPTSETPEQNAKQKRFNEPDDSSPGNATTLIDTGDRENATDSIVIDVTSASPNTELNTQDIGTEQTTFASGRQAPSDEKYTTDASAVATDQENTSGQPEVSTEAIILVAGRDGVTTTEAVVIVDQKEEESTEKSVPTKQVAQTKLEASVTEALPVRTQQEEEQVVDLQPEEGARKFGNSAVHINGGDDNVAIRGAPNQGPVNGFKRNGLFGLNRRRNRRPFPVSNRKPNFVRHRPPYSTLDSDERPPHFLQYAPSASDDQSAYAIDETPIMSDRSDPATRVLLLDAEDSLDPLLEDASSAGSEFYAPFYSPQLRSDYFPPPESPVHYVSVMRSPDGTLPVRDLRMTNPDDGKSQRRRFLQNRNKRSSENATTDCQWVFRSDPGVPLLLTFKSFSTPETPDCKDHYISVERESNGFQSRWCGVAGDRPGHAAFARSEINLQLFSVGDGSFPTGFSVEIQALDLKLLRKYAEVRRIIKGQ